MGLGGLEGLVGAHVCLTHRRDADEDAAVALKHLRKEGLGQEDRPTQVDAVAGVPAIDRYVLDCPHRGDGGVVDHYIDPAEGVQRRRLEPAHALLVAHVGLHEADDIGCELLGQTRLGVRTGLLVYLGQDDPGAEPDQGPGGLEADPPPGPGDDGHLPGERIRRQRIRGSQHSLPSFPQRDHRLPRISTS
jgi:hypothetical protein